MTTIVMVVNNAGSTDGKVAKTAEYLERCGCIVQVVCLTKKGLPRVESINNIWYHRFPLKISLYTAIVALKPSLLRCFIKRKHECSELLSTNDNSNNKRQAINKSNDFRDSFLFNIVKKIFKNKTLYPIILRGCYFSTFYEVLNELEPDYFHAHELDVLESCVLASENKHTKVIYDSHELERFRNLPWSKMAMKIRGAMEGKYIKKAHTIITVSPSITNKIKDIYGITNVITIRNTPSLKFVNYTVKQTLREKLGLPKEIPLIVYTGLITFNRGVEDVINALVYLPEYHLATVGPCNQEVMKKLEILVNKLNVSNRVHFVDKVNSHEVISFISSADVSIIPIKNSCLSYEYCLPNKLFEAMFSGLPIVASNLPDMRDVIDAYQVGEVYTDNAPKCIAEKIINVYINRGKYKSFEITSKINNELTFEKEAEKLSDIYICRS